MYRKRSSIITIKSILSPFSQVIPSLNPFSSSSKFAVKTSPLTHSLWRRSFNVSAQSSDFSPDSDPNGSFQQDPCGSDSGNSTNLQQNPTGWYPSGHNHPNLRADEAGVYRKISDFSAYSNPNGSYQQNPYGSDRGNLTNLQQIPVAYPNGQFNQMNNEQNLGGNGDGIYRERLDFLRYLDSSGSYKQNQYGSDGRNSINLQRNPVGHPNGQFNHTYNCQNSGANGDGIYRERSDFPTYSSSNRFYQHNQFRKNTANLQRNLVGYPHGQFNQIYHAQNLEANVVGINRERSDFSMYSNTNGSYQHEQFGKNPTHLQQNAIAYSDFPAQNSVAEFRRDGSIIGGQFNQMSNGQNLGVNGDGVYRERLDFSHYSDHNGSYHKNQYGRNSTNMQQNPFGYRNDQVNQINRGQNLGTNEDCIHGKTSDFPRYSDPNGNYQQKRYGMNSTNLQQNSIGVKRNNPEETQQWNSQGFYRENQNGYGGGDQFNQMNNGQNLGSNKDGIYRRSSDLSPYSEPDAFYRQSQAGRNSMNLQQNPIGYQSFPIQNSVEGFQRHASIGGKFSQVNNGHDRNSGSSQDTIYSKRSEILPSSDPNASYYRKQSIINSANLQQNPNGYQTNNLGKVQKWNANGYYRENPNGQGIADQFNRMNSDQELATKSSGEDDEYPYENESGFFRGINKKLNQDPDEHYEGGINKELNQDLDEPYEVDPEQLCHEISHGYEKRDPISNEDQNLSEPPLVSSEVISYEDNLYKFDEFCKVGKMKEAIAVLATLEKIGMAVDIPRYLMLIEACGKEKCLEKAKLIHDHLERTVREVEVRVHNKILDMYSKCGLLIDAYQLFEKMPQRNITSWETMISGLANNGLGEEAIDLFTQFKEMGLKPDGGLFAAVFYTCGVLGAADQGMLYFNSMKVDYGIAPLMEHYISIVDMFGRSGHLDEALEFIEMMPIEPNIDVWETLMNFCRVNGYIELGDRCAEIVEQHDSSRLTEQAKKGLLPVKTLEMIKENEIKQNSDEFNVKHYMHEFIAGRPENNMIYEQIRCLAQQMKEAGYVPDIACTLHDVDPENREEALMYHSERLAIVHGLMTSPARRPIRVIKNLRVCRDCHVVMKIISKLTGRLIIARDTKRFHHVENGICSCNDFW